MRWVIQALQTGNELVKAKGSKNGILKDSEGRQKLVPEPLLNKLIVDGTITLKQTDEKGHEHYQLAVQTSVQAKKAADPLNLLIPEAEAQSVAVLLFKSGVTEFEVRSEGGLAYLEFKSIEERNLAAKIVAHAFAAQINAQKGFWGFWAGNEEFAEPSQQRMVSSLTEGAGRLRLDAAFLRRADMPIVRDIDKGRVVQAECPLCGHKPVYEEDPKSGASNKFYCHACNRGFDELNSSDYSPVSVSKSGDVIMVSFGPKGIAGHCLLSPEDLEKVRQLKPGQSHHFRDEQKIEWKVARGFAFFQFQSLGLHGMRGTIPTVKLQEDAELVEALRRNKQEYSRRHGRQ